jgi:hypothetical protein
MDSLQLPSKQVCKLRPPGDCRTWALQVLHDGHVAAPTTVGEHACGSGERSCHVGTVADAPLGRSSNGTPLKRFINKLRCASCFRLACCGVPL